MSKNKKKHGHHKPQSPPPPPPKKVVKRSGCLPWLILLLLIALALYFLIKHFGLFGIGDGDNGKGDGGNKPATSQSETTEAEETKLEITVSGEKYIFRNNTSTLDDFMTEVKKTEGNVVVYVTCDDDAVDDTVNKLKDRLTSEKITFTEVVKNES